MNDVPLIIRNTPSVACSGSVVPVLKMIVVPTAGEAGMAGLTDGSVSVRPDCVASPLET